jgi:hypothetical protein
MNFDFTTTMIDPCEIKTLTAIAQRSLKTTEAQDWTIEQLEEIHWLLKDAAEYVEDFLDAFRPEYRGNPEKGLYNKYNKYRNNDK